GSAINSGKMVVQSQSGVKQFSTTPVLSTAYTLPTNTTQLPYGGKNATFLDTSRVFIVYQDSLDTGKMKAVIGTIASDNSIAYGNPVAIDGNATSTGAAYVYKISSTNVIICCEVTHSYKLVFIIACSISGTTITVGTPITPTGVPASVHSLAGFCLYDSTHALVVYDYFVSS